MFEKDEQAEKRTEREKERGRTKRRPLTSFPLSAADLGRPRRPQQGAALLGKTSKLPAETLGICSSSSSRVKGAEGEGVRGAPADDTDSWLRLLFI